MLISPRSRRRIAGGAAAVAALVVVFCLCLLKKNSGTFFNDDYQISILPVFADVARSWGEGHWPLLSPYSWACANLAGEYQYGTFSLFVNLLVVVVWKFPLAFAQQAAALSITHLAMLAAGAYLLARERRLPAGLAAGVGIIAALNGWNMGWSAIDWFGALAAHAWLPWCWWAFEVAIRKGGHRAVRPSGARQDAQHGGRDAHPTRENGSLSREVEPRREGPRWTLLPVPFVYLLLTAGFPYTVVMLVLVSGWLAARTWFRYGYDWRRLLPLAVGWGLGLMLSAPAWLSLLDAVHGSGRAAQGVGVGNVAWSVPVTALPALILPNWTVPWADFANVPVPHPSLELAGGFVPVAGLLAAVACLRGGMWRRLRWELGLVGAVLLLCLLPSPGLFRWSFRWLPLLHLALALTGGRALHLLASRTRGRRRWVQNPGVWATGCAALAWLGMVAAHTQYQRDSKYGYLPPFTLGVGVAWAALAAVPTRRRGWAAGVAGLAVLAATGGTYRYLETNPHLPIYPIPESLRSVTPLSKDRLYLSFYREADQFYRDWQTPPGFGSLVRMGSTGMFAGVHMINGYSPIMAAGAGKELNIETHGNVPTPDGERLLAEDALYGPGELLDLLGVDGIIITHDYGAKTMPFAERWEEVLDVDEGRVYHRRTGPMSDVREIGRRGTDEAEASIRVVENSRLRVVAEVATPPDRRTPVVVSFRRPFFEGYHATLDGKTLAVLPLNGLMPTVELPPGSRGRLVLWYLPRAVVWGAVLAACGLAGVGGIVCFGGRNFNAEARRTQRVAEAGGPGTARREN